MEGKIWIDNKSKTPVEFANVVLYSNTDTTQIITGTITDLHGNYLFENLETGNFRIVISCIGYKTIIQPIRVLMPSSGHALIRNFTLEEDSKLLSEVKITGQLRHQYIDKANYTFTTDDIKSARYSKDLLESLPELTVDVQTGNITTLKGSSLRILINGVTATDNDLKMLPPNKVVRVEFYDFPPARYAGAGAVVNIITRTLDDGYGGGLDLSHAITTGFGNDNIFGNYNNGRNQVSFEYKINYRNYKDRVNEELYRYLLNDEQRESYYFRKNKFGYTTHTVNLKYTNQLLDNYIFQINVKPNFETRFDDGVSNLITTFGGTKTELYGIEEKETLIVNPTIDLYLWKSLPNDSEFSTNIVGTFFRTSVENNLYEYEKSSGRETLQDEMRLENRQQSMIGEAMYTRNYGLSSWTSGYKLDINWLDSDIDNLFGSYKYNSLYTEQYVYTELTGIIEKILYRFSLGGTYTTAKSYSNKYDRFVFKPQVMFGFQIDQRNTLRMILQRDTEPLTISDLSNNAQVITSDIITKGNPFLVNETQLIGAVLHTLNNRYLTLNTGLAYGYSDKPINQYFTKDSNSEYIILTNENAINSKQYGAMAIGEIKPFGTDIFSIKTSMEFNREIVNSNITGKISNWYIPVFLEGTFKYKKIVANYKYKFTSDTLKGAYLTRDENQSHAILRFNYKNLSVSAGMLWMFMPSRYHKETLPESIVYHKSDTKIRDNKSMLTIGFSWNFNRGKDYKAERTLINEHKDAATF